MNQPEYWTEKDIKGLILEGQEETIRLDFKSADALQSSDLRKAEISKDVSAFANSAGGTLVYGIEEGPEPHHPANALSPVDPAVASKEWLEQVINSRIQPRIQGIVINAVELRVSNPGKYVYVVVVPESSTAHQASDKRYYKRFNFESVRMEDYEIRQTMARASRPGYSVELFLRNVQDREHPFQLEAVLENQSEIVGHDVSVVLLTPKWLVSDPGSGWEGLRDFLCIHATYGEASRAVWNCIPSLPPLLRYPLGFARNVRLPTEPVVDGGRVKAVVRVFDQFGLSLTANFVLQWPNYKPVLENEILAGKTSRLYGSIPAGAGVVP